MTELLAVKKEGVSSNMNNFILVGRIITINDNTITIAREQLFKNEDGIYETNLIDITLNDSMIDNVNEYCKQGDIIGVKGYIQRLNINEPMELIAERVTFLTNKKSDD